VSHSEIALPHGNVQGEPSPFAIVSKKLCMWLFIISDAVTFGAMLFSYGYVRNASTDWPHPFKFFPTIVNVMVMTFILVTSSLTMLLALRAATRGNKSSAVRWIGVTILAGIVFAALHIREWLGLIHEGIGMFHNPWGAPLFGASFFSITGLHLAHVVSGVVILTVVAIGYRRSRYTTQDIEVWALYWHFVDLVWMFVVPFVYLLSVAK
jgi:cytochrome c oxidase subunit III